MDDWCQHLDAISMAKQIDTGPTHDEVHCPRCQTLVPATTVIPEPLIQTLTPLLTARVDTGHLQTLDLSRAFLEGDMSRMVGEPDALYSLTLLSLARNSLTHLPDMIAALPALTALNISHNELTSLPAWLSTCPHLAVLNVGHNLLGRDSEVDVGVLDGSLALERLFVEGNALISPPFRSLRALPSLQVLIMSDNALDAQSMGSEIWDGGEGLTELALHNNPGAGSLPGCLYRFRRLRVLNASNMGLLDVPPQIGSLDKLVRLNLSHNPEIDHLPPDILSLASLERLNMAYTSITDIPELPFLEALRYVNIAGTHVLSLSGDISKLPNLHKIVFP